MGRYIINLVEEITKKKEVDWLIFVYSSSKKYFPEKDNIHYIVLPDVYSHKLLRIMFEQCILPFILLKYNVNIYHNPCFSLPMWCPCKSIVTIADLTFFSHPQYHLSQKNMYFRFMIPYAIKKADAVIAISENTKEDIINSFPSYSKKIHATLLAHDSYFKPIDKEHAKQFVHNKYKLPSSFILFVVMVEPRKNIKAIIDAFSMLNPSLQLVIVGKKGWAYEDIFQSVKEKRLEEKVIFTGYVSDQDLPYFYSAASVFVYPSFYEGFGIPVLEAMACGCPVVTSNNSSMKEIAGNAALLVDPYSVDSIKNAMKAILKDVTLQKILSKKGITHARNFTWKLCAEKTLKVYNEIGRK